MATVTEIKQYRAAIARAFHPEKRAALRLALCFGFSF